MQSLYKLFFDKNELLFYQIDPVLIKVLEQKWPEAGAGCVTVIQTFAGTGFCLEWGAEEGIPVMSDLSLWSQLSVSSVFWKPRQKEITTAQCYNYLTYESFFSLFVPRRLKLIAVKIIWLDQNSPRNVHFIRLHFKLKSNYDLICIGINARNINKSNFYRLP